MSNVIAGFLVGLLVGFAGVGGGSLMTPLLVLLFGVAPATAVGTDLLVAAANKTVGGFVHGVRGAIDWRVACRLWLGSVPAACVTLYFIRQLQPRADFGGVLMHLVGWALLITGTVLIFQTRLHQHRSVRMIYESRLQFAQPAFTTLSGALVGALVTMTSIGAGALTAVMLVYLYPYRLTPPKLVATDLVHAIPVSLIAGLGHVRLGNVDFSLLEMLLVGSIPGVLLGSRLSHLVAPRVLRIAIALLLLALGVRMLFAA